MGPFISHIDCAGEIRATLQSYKYTFNEDVYVMKNLEQPLLGRTLSSKVNDTESVKIPVYNYFG